MAAEYHQNVRNIAVKYRFFFNQELLTKKEVFMMRSENLK